MPKYKGFDIRKTINYRIHESGYTLSNASTLAQAKRMAAGLANKRGTRITVEKEISYSIQKDGFTLSNAKTVIAAKQQINKW